MFVHLSLRCRVYLTGLVLAIDGEQPGDCTKLGELIIDLGRGEGVAEGKKLPSALLLGDVAFGFVEKDLNDRMKILQEWKPLLTGTNRPGI